jgi:hypothetical protein
VFTIAITLLIIEIGVPHLEEKPPGATLPQALVGPWPSYLGYVISFLQIGVIWINHHNRFRLIESSDHGLLFLNVVFLMCVAFIPFPNALLAEYLEGSGPPLGDRRRHLRRHLGRDRDILHPALTVHRGESPRGPRTRPFAAADHNATLRARDGRIPAGLFGPFGGGSRVYLLRAR